MSNSTTNLATDAIPRTRMSSARQAAAVLLFAVAASGCAGILGLDSGTEVDDDAGPSATRDSAVGVDGEAADAAAIEDAAIVVDADTTPDTSTLTCAPNTADCNRNASDGCETKLNDPLNCGRCGNKCALLQACMAETCCLPAHTACTDNGQCCSGKCGPGASGCH